LCTSLKGVTGRARYTGRTALRQAHGMERVGDRAEIDHARQNLADVLAFERLEPREAGELLRVVDAELEAAFEIGIGRARHGREDLARLRSIHRKAFGRDVE
jgi:hypothetical protein